MRLNFPPNFGKKLAYSFDTLYPFSPRYLGFAGSEKQERRVRALPFLLSVLACNNTPNREHQQSHFVSLSTARRNDSPALFTSEYS